MESAQEFNGKKILVTGGANGLGKAIVEKFYQEGAEVYALDKDAGALAALTKEYPNVKTRQVDLLDFGRTKEIIQEISPLHHLVNNAGVFLPALLTEVTMENFDITFGINIKATVNVTQAFVKGNGGLGGTIVNISSYADIHPILGGVSYNCSKAAMSMLSKCMAIELGPAFRVNFIRPTAMTTDMMTTIVKNNPELVAAAKSRTDRSIIKERVQVSDCADLVFFLSSSKSKRITGEGVAIDCGMGIN